MAGEISRFVRDSPRRAIAITAGAVVLLLVLLHFLGAGKIEPGTLSHERLPAPNQPTGTVTLERMPESREVIGSVQSRIPVDVASRVMAAVHEVTVRAGDRVKRGQVLVVLDSADLKAHVAQAEGQLAAARAELTRTTADQRRFTALFSRGSVTEREMESAEAAYRAAGGSVTQARAAVAAARAALKYATVRSPVDGVVADRMVEPGDMAVAGKSLVRLYDENALRVQLHVPEELAGHIKAGTPLIVRVDAVGESARTAVSEVVPEADPSSRSFLVRAPLPTGHGLRPGMFARAIFAIGTEKVLTAPRAAIASVGQLDTARVISNGAVEVREVSLGRTFGDRVEVLAGLHAGEKVLLDSDQAGAQ